MDSLEKYREVEDWAAASISNLLSINRHEAWTIAHSIIFESSPDKIQKEFSELLGESPEALDFIIEVISRSTKIQDYSAKSQEDAPKQPENIPRQPGTSYTKFDNLYFKKEPEVVSYKKSQPCSSSHTRSSPKHSKQKGSKRSDTRTPLSVYKSPGGNRRTENTCINNCLNCGYVIQDFIPPCVLCENCDEIVELGDGLKDELNPDLKNAIEQRDRLLKLQKESDKISEIRDKASDFNDAAYDIWLTPKQRENMLYKAKLKEEYSRIGREKYTCILDLSKDIILREIRETPKIEAIEVSGSEEPPKSQDIKPREYVNPSIAKRDLKDTQISVGSKSVNLSSFKRINKNYDVFKLDQNHDNLLDRIDGEDNEYQNKYGDEPIF